MTIYCFRPRVLYDVLAGCATHNGDVEFGRDVIPQLLHQGRKVYGFKFGDYWGYTRTIAEYWQTSMDLLGVDPAIKIEDWGIRTNLEHRAIRDYQPLQTGPNAAIKDSLVYNGCVIEGVVEHSILFPGVKVGRGAVVQDSILFFDNVVGENVCVSKTISDVNVTFGEGCRVGWPAGADDLPTVIGWSNVIPPATSIGRNCTIYPRLDPARLTGKIKNGEVVK
jgi:glucose-1-phosphate adenylyltransferase